MILRPYQEEAQVAIRHSLSEASSCLLVQPTGTGKTVTFCEYAHRHTARNVMIVCPRSELVKQTVKTLGRMGLDSIVEMAERNGAYDQLFAQQAPRIIVGTVNSLCQARRLARYPADKFDLLIFDEAHHAVLANSMYAAILDHFSRSKVKIIGATATPDRADKAVLGEVFERVAFDYPLQTALDEGYLVQPEQHWIRIHGFDLDRCKVVDGDLVAGQLDELLTNPELQIAFQIATEAFQRCRHEPTLIFCPGVDSAKQVCEALCLQGARAKTVTGSTPSDVRDLLYEAFERGEFSYLVGCDVFVEGFDSPTIRNVVVARTTGSRSRYVQIVGRGLRLLPGIIDGLHTKEARLAAIAASGKPTCKVYDLHGNSTKHTLISVVDIFAGEFSLDIKKAAKERMQKEPASGANAKEVCEAIKQEFEQKAKLALKTESSSTRVGIDSRALDGSEVPVYGQYTERVNGPSIKQAAILLKAGYDPNQFTRQQASGIISKIHKEKEREPATDGQQRHLDRFNECAPWTKLQASFILDLCFTRKDVGYGTRTYELSRECLFIKKKKDGKYYPGIKDPDIGECVGTLGYRTESDCREFLKGVLEVESGVPA